MDCQALLQGIFQTQAWKPTLLHLLHWQACSLPLVPTEKPNGQRLLFTFYKWKGFFKLKITHVETIIRSYSTSRNKMPIEESTVATVLQGKMRKKKRSLAFHKALQVFQSAINEVNSLDPAEPAFWFFKTPRLRDRGQGQCRRSLAHPLASATTAHLRP